MDPLLISILAIVAFLVLISLEMPIAFAFATVGTIGILLIRGFDPAAALLGSAPYTWATSNNLLAIPLFILMGELVVQSGISNELFDFANKWVGKFRGGLAIATTVACTAFGACCGTSIAAAATMSGVCFPPMQKYFYSQRLSTGCIAAGGSLSCLIPPSVSFIVYGTFTQTSISKLFVAGILPGLVLATLYIMLIVVMCKINPKLGPAGPTYTWKQKFVSTKGLVPTLILFIIVMGGLFAGIITPSEAGAAGAFGAFIIVIIRRKLTFSTFMSTFKNSSASTCFIVTLVIGAMIFSNFLAVGGFSAFFKDFITSLPVPPHLVVVCIFLIYIPLGMVMDGLAMLLLTLPIVFPIVISYGYDPIWFGVMMTLLIEMALLTPPVAVNVYVVQGVTKVPMSEVFRGVFPFFGTMFACLVVLFMFPQIITFLPSIVK
jgi:C4-dicarboxylate transporter DctM subunit